MSCGGFKRRLQCFGCFDCHALFNRLTGDIDIEDRRVPAMSTACGVSCWFDGFAPIFSASCQSQSAVAIERTSAAVVIRSRGILFILGIILIVIPLPRPNAFSITFIIFSVPGLDCSSRRHIYLSVNLR